MHVTSISPTSVQSIIQNVNVDENPQTSALTENENVDEIWLSFFLLFYYEMDLNIFPFF